MEELKYLRLLAERFPTVAAVSTEIINLSAILCLPKGTEHMISDIHGEYGAFLHMLKNASGVVREKIDNLFRDSVPAAERDQLATLIYYPREKLELVHESEPDMDAWYERTLPRLVEVCRYSAAKYTRSKVRKALPKGFEYIIDELLHAADTDSKQRYQKTIMETIVGIGRADAFIVAVCELISRLTIDRLHIVGDIYDRGPGAHIVMDALEHYHDVDFQWGNHDMLWMGAAAGCDALIATAIINSLKYGNIDTLEEGYGISLSPLVAFALSAYRDDPCLRFMPKILDADNAGGPQDPDVAAKVHKAMAVILFKLEGDIIRRNPQFGMDGRLLMDKVDFEQGTVAIGGQVWALADTSFPTVLPSDPFALSVTEQDIVSKLRRAFLHSGKLQEHVRFLLSRGGMYLCCNQLLLFHGCVPVDEQGAFIPVSMPGGMFAGRAYLDEADALVRKAFAPEHARTAERQQALDFMYYLWCGPNSPLFGKDQMTTFERYFIADKGAHTEHKSTYFKFAEEGWFADRLFSEFGLDPARAHVVNGHVPVKIKKGESPVKAGGKLLVIDGGMSKAYQSETGIAGYTLIYSSNELALSCHDPFVTVEEAVRNEVDIHSTQTVVESFDRRMLVADTDRGAELKEQIRDLKRLLDAYRDGRIKENAK